MMLSVILLVAANACASTTPSVKLTPVGDIWAAQVFVNSQPVTLLIDTGSPNTFLYEHSNSRKHIGSQRKVTFNLGGISRILEARSEKGTTADQKSGIDGVLGMDALAGLQLLFDFKNQSMNFYSESSKALFDFKGLPETDQENAGSKEFVFHIDKNNYPVFKNEKGLRYVLDTASGGVFSKRQPTWLSKSLGLMDINLFDKVSKREVFLCFGISDMDVDLAPVFEPISNTELPEEVDGTLPLNDLLSPVLLIDFSSGKLWVKTFKPLEQSFVRLSKLISYNIQYKKGKLVVGYPLGPSPQNPEHKLTGLEIMAIGDFTASEIINWLDPVNVNSLNKIATFIERRHTDMVMLLKSEKGVMRGKLVGTKQ